MMGNMTKVSVSSLIVSHHAMELSAADYRPHSTPKWIDIIGRALKRFLVVITANIIECKERLRSTGSMLLL